MGQLRDTSYGTFSYKPKWLPDPTLSPHFTPVLHLRVGNCIQNRACVTLRTQAQETRLWLPSRQSRLLDNISPSQWYQCELLSPMSSTTQSKSTFICDQGETEIPSDCVERGDENFSFLHKPLGHVSALLRSCFCPPLSLQPIVKSGQSTSRCSIIGNRCWNVALAFDATYSPRQNQDNRESKRPYARQASGEYNSARKNRAQEGMLLEFNRSHTTPRSTRPVCQVSIPMRLSATVFLLFLGQNNGFISKPIISACFQFQKSYREIHVLCANSYSQRNPYWKLLL